MKTIQSLNVLIYQINFVRNEISGICGTKCSHKRLKIQRNVQTLKILGRNYH